MNNVYLIVTIGHTSQLLERLLRYYQELGIRNFLIIIHTPQGHDPFHVEVERVLQRLDCPIAATWHGPFSEHKKIRVEHQVIDSSCAPDDWVIYADGDEFHEFPDGLCGLKARCEQRDYSYVKGRLLDRVAADGSLPPIDANHLLEDLFPLGGELTESLLKGSPEKVVAARACRKVAIGHHYLALRNRPFEWNPLDPPGGMTDRLTVHHFKWDQGVLWRMAKNRAEKQNHLQAWYEEMNRFTRHLRRTGRIDVHNPAFQFRHIGSRIGV